MRRTLDAEGRRGGQATSPNHHRGLSKLVGPIGSVGRRGPRARAGVPRFVLAAGQVPRRDREPAHAARRKREVVRHRPRRRPAARVAVDGCRRQRRRRHDGLPWSLRRPVVAEIPSSSRTVSVGREGRARIAALARLVARRARTRRTSEPIGSESSHARKRSNSVRARSAPCCRRGAAQSPAVWIAGRPPRRAPPGPGGAAGGPAAVALVAADIAAPPGHLHPPDRGRHPASDDQHLAERQLRDLRRGQHRDPADRCGGAAGEVVERGHVLVAFPGQGDVGGQVLVVAGAAEDQHGGGVVEDRRRTGRAVALAQLRAGLGADVDGDVRSAHVRGPRLQRQRADDRRLVQRQRQRRLQPPRRLLGRETPRFAGDVPR